MQKSLLFCLLIGLIACASGPHKEDDSDKKHSMNDKFLKDDLNVKLWQERFENRDRDVYKNREKIVEALKLEPGQYLADVGAGTGFYLKLFHDKLTETGKIYAVELAPKFIEFIEARSKAEGLSTVTAIKGGLDSTNLPANSVDIIFLCDTYHHFDNPQLMLKDFFRVLRKGGRLVIVDFNLIPGKSRKWILDHITKTKAQYIQEISLQYFKFSHESKINLDENFMLHFIRN